jgi:hypothetical protein
MSGVIKTDRQHLGGARVALIGGIAGILFCELALFANVLGWLKPGDFGFGATRIVRGNMTPICWLLYVMACVGGISLMDGRGWMMRWRRRFLVCSLWSVSAWCYFDVINFYFIHAWKYVGMPERFADRLGGYLIAFGAIAPGMFLSAEVLMRLGMRRIRAGAFRLPRAVLFIVMMLGAAGAALPFVVHDPIANLTLWVGTFLFLDPLNALMGRPSILMDWSAGRWGRTLALGAGGLWCGLLWEFWNFWAGAKWIYDLPFLGAWQQVKYFEMPVPGLFGFISFGFQTWVMWQTSLIVLAPFVEGERGTAEDRAYRDWTCF